MSIHAERIAKLEEALASGLLTIESEGERLTYRSTAELRSAIDYYRRREAEGVAVRRPASTVAVFDPR